MTDFFNELEELRVIIDRVVYTPHLEAPVNRPHPFVYFITIRNDSDQTVTIKGRKWVVTESNGQRVVVEGDGIRLEERIATGGNHHRIDNEGHSGFFQLHANCPDNHSRMQHSRFHRRNRICLK